MLPCVAGKDDATICFLHEPQKIEHLLPTDLPGFINDHDRTFRQRSALNEFGDRLHIFQPVATEIDYLLTLRGGGLGDMPGSTKRILHATEHETFPGARATAEQRDEVRRLKNLPKRAKLVGSKFASVKLLQRCER